ncbi:DUF4199 domain-containing protein [Dawidia soli]|uniref:DUF4199 family protein n=1 Tax=Dawidia soli TaxID=2782352 RepID=A0AAP2GFL5_9BACT|nr:DUF4199 domain-containing protein [Dawidia soli]MBT1689584.1 DUF4199 family protein [Dawidia soli]
MENTVARPTTISIGIKWGLISTLIHVIIFLITSVIGTDPFDQKMAFVNVPVSIAVLVLAHKAFKDGGDGFMSYGQGVAIAFWISLFGVILGGLFTFVYINFVDTALMDAYYQKQMDAMSEKKMSDQQIEMAITWTKKLFWPIYVFFGIFFGVLIGLIVTIFTHKKNPEPTF